MEIIWEVDDGYVGGSRPHHTEVNEDDIRDCETLEEAMQLVDDMVEEDYNMEISWYIKNREKIIDKVKEMLDNKEKEEEY